MLYSLTFTLNKLTVILNLLGSRSTLLTNDNYVMNTSDFMTDLPLVSSCLYTLLKNYMYFMKLLENFHKHLNCLRQHPGFHFIASSHAKIIVHGTTP